MCAPQILHTQKLNLPQQRRKTQQKKKELRELSLPKNSNEVKLDYSVPIIEINFDDPNNKTRIGVKSSEHERLEYQQCLKQAEYILEDPAAIWSFIITANERRKNLEQIAVEDIKYNSL